MGAPDFDLITDLSIHAAQSAMNTALDILNQIPNPRDRVMAVATTMGLLKGQIDRSMERANTAHGDHGVAQMTTMLQQAGEALARNQK
jgi:hypothetical protein